MSGRCRSCNTVLTDEELCYKTPLDGQYTDLCFRCLSLGEEGEDDFDGLFDPHKDELWEQL
jgi:hypothetical protein